MTTILTQGDNRVCYIYNKDSGWIVDNNHVLMDRLMGYDETEEPGSPYKLGNMDMLIRIDKITKDEAMRLINTHPKELINRPDISQGV